MSGIQVGVDKISLHNEISKNLIIGGFIYIAVSAISLLIFAPFLDMIKMGMVPS